jgi:hypothetical protein
MSADGNNVVGAMQILAADGKWKFGPTDQDDPGPGNGRARARVYHFRGNNGPATPGCLPHPVRAAMVTFCPDEARLAEERAYIPARWRENPDTHDQGSCAGQGHSSSLCGKRQQVVGPYGGGSRDLPSGESVKVTCRS